MISEVLEPAFLAHTLAHKLSRVLLTTLVSVVVLPRLRKRFVQRCWRHYRGKWPDRSWRLLDTGSTPSMCVIVEVGVNGRRNGRRCGSRGGVD